jgi:class 3 adenylate cyclase
MKARFSDPRLNDYAECFEALRWSALIIDADWTLVWASEHLKEFIRATDGSDLGFGLHIAEALLKDAWLSGMTPDSVPKLLSDVGPQLLYTLEKSGRPPQEVMPPQFLSMLEGMKPAPPPRILRTSFLALDPADPELPPYPVNVCALRINDEDGSFIAWVAIFFMGISPNLLTLLARGNEEMYERMARLVEPKPRQGAVLFCDLHSSGEISRQLPSINYFKLIRSLWTCIDEAVADNTGVIGKHAGDGASAYFLVDDLGSPSAAASAAIKTAARIHDLSEEVFRGVLETACQMRVGLHWGGNLYMGQLIPGSRLDVSALGDEVNEAARIQEATGPGETLASKQLLEQLIPEDAAAVGIDVEKILYQPLIEVAPGSDKVARDAATLPVTMLSGLAAA